MQECVKKEAIDRQPEINEVKNWKKTQPALKWLKCNYLKRWICKTLSHFIKEKTQKAYTK